MRIYAENKKFRSLLATLFAPFRASTNRFVVLSLLVVIAFYTESTQAGSASWIITAADGDWITDANWSPAAAPGSTSGTTSPDIATFNLNVAIFPTVNVDANRNIGGITFNHTSTGGKGYTLAGGNLRLTSGGIIQYPNTGGGNKNAVNSPIEIQGDGGNATCTSSGAAGVNTGLSIGGAVTGVSSAGNTTTLTLNGGNNDGNTFVSGIIGDGTVGGKLALVKSGAGIWGITGVNTFTGDLTINQGTLSISSLAASGISSAIGAGSTITFGGSSGGNLIYTGSASLSTSINRAINIAFTATSKIAVIQNDGGNPLVFNGTFSNTAAASTVLSLGGSNTGANDFQSMISDNGANAFLVTKAGVGTWTLSNNGNTFTGQLQINDGTLSIATLSDFGIASATGKGISGTGIRLGNGAITGTLNYTGAGNTSSRTVTIGNTTAGNAGGGRIQNSGANGGSGLIFTATTFNTTISGITATRTLTLGGANTDTNEIRGAIVNNAAGGLIALTKADAGKWILSGANTYSGTTTISNGTLQVGKGTSGSLNGTTGTALTFGGTGSFDVQEAANSAQGMGLLTINAGEGTVKSTYPGSGNTALTFANLAARAVGTAANFVTSGGANGTTTKIILTQFAGSSVPTGALLDKAIFFSGSSYASYDTSTYLRAYTSGDANYVGDVSGANAIANDSSKNVALNGNVTAQATAAVNTLNMGANNVTLDNTAVFSANGILSAGSGSAAISKTTASSLQVGTSGGELVIRVDGSSDTLTIEPVIQNNTLASALTKSGSGNLILTGVNTYTGVTAIATGTLTIGGTGKLGNGNYAGVISGAGSLVYSSSATQTLSGASTFAGDVNINAGIVNADGPRANANTFSALGSLTVARNINIAANATLWVMASVNNNDSLGSTSSQIPVIINVNGGTLKVGYSTINFIQTFNTVNLNGGTMTVNSSAATAVAILNGTVTVGGTAASTMNRGSTGANFSLSNVGTRNTMFNVGDVVSGTDLTVSAPVANGTGNTTTWPASSLTKIGAGTMLLTTNNTYTGTTTINAGTLQVNGKIDSSDVTVMTNAVLCGTGTLGSNVTVNVGGILAAGTTNANTVVISTAIAGTLTLQDNSRLLVDVQSLSQNDLITVAGNVTLTNTLKLEVSGGVTRSGTWTILQSTGGTISGTLPTTVLGAPKGASLAKSGDSKQLLLTFPPQGTMIRLF